MRIVLSLILFSFGLSAQAEPFIGPSSSALGGSGRAGLSGAESVFLNPALVPLIQMTEVIGYYRDGQYGPDQHRNAWMLGAVDSSKEAYFPAAFHYGRLRDSGRTNGAADGEIYHLAIGKNVSERLAVGISGYYLKYAVKDDKSYSQWNGSLGILILVTENMGFAYVLNNFAGPGSDVPGGLREDMNQGVGVYGAIAEIARLRVDVTRRERFNPHKKLAYMAGIESMLSEYFVFRAGFRRDELSDERFYTAGVGFTGPRLKIDYGFEKNAKGAEGAVHSVDMRVPF